MPRTTSRVLLFALVLAVFGAACSDAGDAADGPGDGTPVLDGSLCSQLPLEGSPGGPDALVDEPVDVALAWLPVGTVFEAGARATGLDEELVAAEGVTLLIPTDGGFDEMFGEEHIDELLLFEHDELRSILERHIIDGRYTLQELIDAGTATTWSGDTVTITARDDLPIFDEKIGTECGGYESANATMHLVGLVIGPYEPPFDDEGHTH